MVHLQATMFCSLMARTLEYPVMQRLFKHLNQANYWPNYDGISCKNVLDERDKRWDSKFGRKIQPIHPQFPISIILHYCNKHINLF